MSFSVLLFAAEPEQLREKVANDVEMVPGIRARLTRRGAAAAEIDELCARVSAARSLNWPAAGGMLSVDVFLLMLDYAAEPINVARLRDVRYSSVVDEVPLLAEMVADQGPLPVPDVRALPCEIGFVAPNKLRELAERGPPEYADPHLDVGSELVEVFESLSNDNLGLYTIIDGAKITRGNTSRAAAAQGPSRPQLQELVRTLIADSTNEEEDGDPGDPLCEIDRQLLEAAESGALDKAGDLLKEGADVNAKRRDGYTAFLLALIEDHNDVCRLLLEAGARVDATIDDGSSAMHAAAFGGNVEGLDLLHRLGLPVDARDSDGRTPLMQATLEASEWLLRHGADVNAADNDGWTALHDAYARSLEYEEEGLSSPFIELLERYGADPTIKDDQGRTPRDFPVR
jgi:hypothetical protein